MNDMTNEMKGRFFVFEGIDGAGKSTLCDRISTELEKEGFKVRVTQEPTHDEIGSFIRNEGVKGISQKAEALLFVADRAVHTERIRKWVDEGDIVLCDRYFASTVAYQSSPLNGVALDKEWLISLNEPVVMDSDRTFLLDLDAETSLKRVGGRGDTSKFETLEYLIKVRARYVELAERYGFDIIDANKDQTEIFDKIMLMIRERL